MDVSPVLSKPEVSTVDGITYVSFGTDYKTITEDVIPAATETLLSVASAAQPRIVINLAHTDFFGSSFIEVLFRVWKRVTQRGGKFALCQVAPYCVEVLKVTHLDTLWPICDTPEDARKAVLA
jgi:anti-anti-sigma factor